MRHFIAVALVCLAALPAHAQAPLCREIFSPSSALLNELVQLRLEIDRIKDVTTSRTLYANFQTKTLEARALGLDLAQYQTQLRLAHEESLAVERESERRRKRAIRLEQLPPWIKVEDALAPSPMAAGEVLPDGKHVVYSDGSYEMKWKKIEANESGVWLTTTLQPIAITVSPNGKFATFFEVRFQPTRSYFELVDLSSGRIVKRLNGKAAAFSIDGSTLAVASAQKITLYSLPDLQPRVINYRAASSVESMTFTPDGKQIGFISDKGREVLDIHSGTIAHDERVPGRETKSWVTADLKTLVYAASNREIYVVHPDGREVKLEQDFSANWPKAVLSADGEHFALVTDDNVLRVFDTESGKLMEKVKSYDHLKTIKLGADNKTLLIESKGAFGVTMMVYRWQAPPE